MTKRGDAHTFVVGSQIPNSEGFRRTAENEYFLKGDANCFATCSYNGSLSLNLSPFKWTDKNEDFFKGNADSFVIG